MRTSPIVVAGYLLLVTASTIINSNQKSIDDSRENRSMHLKNHNRFSQSSNIYLTQHSVYICLLLLYREGRGKRNSIMKEYVLPDFSAVRRGYVQVRGVLQNRSFCHCRLVSVKVHGCRFQGFVWERGREREREGGERERERESKKEREGEGEREREREWGRKRERETLDRKEACFPMMVLLDFDEDVKSSVGELSFPIPSVTGCWNTAHQGFRCKSTILIVMSYFMLPISYQQDCRKVNAC